MNYRIDDTNRILVVLEKGDEIFKSLHALVNQLDITFGWINGIGAIEDITLGSYSVEKKDYIKKEFTGEFELTSLSGNITTKNNEPFIHIHVNISDEECNAYGGHLFSATITATCEIIIFISDNHLYRQESEDIGLYLWNLECK